MVGVGVGVAVAGVVGAAVGAEKSGGRANV